MRVNDIKKVKPAGSNVIVKLIEPDKDDDLFIAKSEDKDLKNAPLSIAEIVAIGPFAGRQNAAPDIEVGDNVVHNTFAGTHIVTEQVSELYKIMDGYSVMAKLDDINNINERTIHPSTNRLLIAVKFLDETTDSLFIPEIDAKDPRLEDLGFGVVVSIGPSCKLGYKVGDIVAYQPYCGENVRKAISIEKPALRVLNEEDVLLTI